MDNLFKTAVPIVRRICSRNSIPSFFLPYIHKLFWQRWIGPRHSYPLYAASGVLSAGLELVLKSLQLLPLATAGSLSAGLELVLKMPRPSMVSSPAITLTFPIFVERVQTAFPQEPVQLEMEVSKDPANCQQACRRLFPKS